MQVEAGVSLMSGKLFYLAKIGSSSVLEIRRKVVISGKTKYIIDSFGNAKLVTAQEFYSPRPGCKLIKVK